MSPKPTFDHLNTRLHGIYANQVIHKNERVLFRTLLARSRHLHPKANPLAVELLALQTVQLFRAYKADHWEAADRLGLMVIRLIREMGATNNKKQPESSETACEQVSDLLATLEEGMTKDAGSDEA